jgi:beta-lactamase class D
VRDFNYGNADVSGNPGKHDGLTRAWLSSSLKISPLEQLAFLQKIVRRELPVSANAFEMTSRIMAMDSLPNGWILHGKTGTGAPLKADGSEDWDHPYGWFVGWATKGGRSIVYVRQVQEERKQSGAGPRTRDAFLRELPAILDSF